MMGVGRLAALMVVTTCPADWGAVLHLTFATAGRTEVQAALRPAGCGYVDLHPGGRRTELGYGHPALWNRMMADLQGSLGLSFSDLAGPPIAPISP